MKNGALEDQYLRTDWTLGGVLLEAIGKTSVLFWYYI
jgi:hypothetical protein